MPARPSSTPPLRPPVARPYAQSLHDATWRVRAVNPGQDVPARARRWFPASIPGCVHLDLMRSGVIGDPAVGFNELRQFWVGATDWEYRAAFPIDPALLAHERIDLACDGIDTIASLHLDGVPIGDAANMFHPHRFDVTQVLRNPARRSRGVSSRLHELVVRFVAPLTHIRREEARLGARPVNGEWDPYIFIRKAACNFGWDWGPKVPTVGLWKPVRLEGWSGARFSGVRPLVVRADRSRAAVQVHVDVQRSGEPSALLLQAELRREGRARPVARAEVSLAGPAGVVHLDVKRPALWWPAGHGGQPLYTLRASLKRSGRVVARTSARIGLRTVRLNTDSDRWGSQFQIEVNARPIFCAGANWIPDDLFPTRITPARLRRRVKQAADANMNMLRVWGGGYYEDDAFYDACDRLGVLVWQDFMFACAMYPEEPPFPALVEAEARSQVTRLSSHPSIALWCGGNECVWGWQKWGWKQRLQPGQSWGAAYYFELLPRIMRELDPTRPYWPNSPLSLPPSPAPPHGSGRSRRRTPESPAPDDSPSLTHDVLDPSHGDRHTWDAQFDEYRNTIPRFLSEFGRQAPADRRTLLRAIGRAGLRVDSPELQHRQRATGGNPVIYDAALARFNRSPRDFREWHVIAQELQSQALSIGCTWATTNYPRCMGVLIWQLNDCWPALSWSLIDSAGRPKPAYHAVAAAFARRPR